MEVVELRLRQILLTQDSSPEPVRQNFEQLVTHVGTSRNSKDVVQLLKRTLLGLRQPEEDHSASQSIHTSVETKGTSSTKSAKLAGEGERNDSGPEIVGGNGPGHTNLTMRKREDFGRVGEGDRTLTRRVESVEQVDEESNQSQVSSRRGRDQETKTRCQQRPAHVGEGEEQKCTTSIGIDRPYSWPGENEVDDTEAPGGEESASDSSSSLGEDT